MKTGISVLVLAAALMGGCAHRYQLADTQAVNLQAPPPAGYGRICVIRPGTAAWNTAFVVKDNNKLVGATRGDSYFCYLAEAGDHHITSTTPTDMEEAWATVEPGRSYFLQQRATDTFQQTAEELKWLPEDQALQSVRELHYRTLVGVPSREELPRPLPVAQAAGPSRG